MVSPSQRVLMRDSNPERGRCKQTELKWRLNLPQHPMPLLSISLCEADELKNLIFTGRNYFCWFCWRRLTSPCCYRTRLLHLASVELQVFQSTPLNKGVHNTLYLLPLANTAHHIVLWKLLQLTELWVVSEVRGVGKGDRTIPCMAYHSVRHAAPNQSGSPQSRTSG